MAKKIQEKQQKFNEILHSIQKDFIRPIHEAMKLFLVSHPEIEAVSYTTRGGEYNDNGYDGFGLRGPFFRIRPEETFIYADKRRGTEHTVVDNSDYDWRDEADLDRWNSMRGYSDELLESVNSYLAVAPHMLLEYGADALLIWTLDNFRVSNVVDDSWDA